MLFGVVEAGSPGLFLLTAVAPCVTATLHFQGLAKALYFELSMPPQRMAPPGRAASRRRVGTGRSTAGC